MKQLILGGARSGKSAYAENRALVDGHLPEQKFYYLATATIGKDSEMLRRIELHQCNRDARWQLIEEPLDVAVVIRKYNRQDNYLLIDCLTLWLTNALLDNSWPTRKADFLDAVQSSQANLYLVSNEVGSGIVPLGELSRQFVDESGWLHQSLAQQCEQVTLVVAGLPLVLKAG
ncbi:MAG: adenosylcobinamide kinase/adenosylcobinamide-phosphate guanylyltransferase [Kiritimatiellia bacterium]|jgi:adenosylcobinamide kinase/adenosylcobinamide-phosphate guanylyltransferase